jgi:predicted transcriptional regulator of viral defense system
LPYRPTVRYCWGNVPTLEIVQSLRPDGYFSHFTAVELNGLTEQIPKTVYLNFEQKLSGGGGHLTQEGINRAFRSKCRVSSNLTTFRDLRICIVNGQNTHQLGVSNIETGDGSKLRVTNIERTLIDITVRPVYSGGPFEVARAFKLAHGQLSVNRLVSYLRKLNFTYPYHQAIGFYLDRTGLYSTAQLDLLRQFEMEHDFYLAHKIEETDYIAAWRLFVPKGF